MAAKRGQWCHVDAEPHRIGGRAVVDLVLDADRSSLPVRLIDAAAQVDRAIGYATARGTAAPRRPRPPPASAVACELSEYHDAIGIERDMRGTRIFDDRVAAVRSGCGTVTSRRSPLGMMPPPGMCTPILRRLAGTAGA